MSDNRSYLSLFQQKLVQSILYVAIHITYIMISSRFSVVMSNKPTQFFFLTEKSCFQEYQIQPGPMRQQWALNKQLFHRWTHSTTTPSITWPAMRNGGWMPLKRIHSTHRCHSMQVKEACGTAVSYLHRHDRRGWTNLWHPMALQRAICVRGHGTIAMPSPSMDQSVVSTVHWAQNI